MKKHRFVLVGVGGTGTWLSMALAASIEFTKDLDPKMFVLIDGDTFEPKNQERQHVPNLGPKAEVRASDLAPMFPTTWIVPKVGWVVDAIPEGVEEAPDKLIIASTYFEEDDVIITAVDNFKARRDILDGVQHLKNVHVFLPGNDEEYGGSLYHYWRRDGEDVTPNPVEFKPELAEPPDRNPGLMSCAERAEVDGGTQFIWTNMAVAAFTGAKINEVILKVTEKTPTWDECMFDLRTGEAWHVRWHAMSTTSEASASETDANAVTAELVSAS